MTSPIVTTPNDIVQTLISGLNGDQANLSTLEKQISSGLAITSPADNPTGAAQLLQLQANLTRFNQYVTNANDASGWLQSANGTVGSVLNVLQQVKGVVESVSGEALSGNPTAIQSIAMQVQGSLQQLLNLANTTYEGGQPIFAGTGNATTAYDSSGNYLGAGNAPTRTVAPGTKVAVSLTGPEVFGTGTTGLLTNGAQQGVLSQIVSDLQANTPASLAQVTGADLQSLNAAIETVQSAAAQLGANAQAVQGYTSQANTMVTTVQQQLGSLQDVNMAQAITNLQLQQTAYQAALYATSQLSSDSLAHYL